jgi:hypothetical protein
MDNNEDKFIFESPDGGKTVFKRKFGEDFKTLIKKETPNFFSYLEFEEMKKLAETNSSIKIALDNLLLIYYTIKDDRKD